MLVGALAVACVPAAIVVAEKRADLELLDAAVAVPVAAVLGLAAYVLGTRARRRAEFTLGRVGGSRSGTVGRWLGMLGLYIALTATLALGFYGLLTLFD